MGWWTWWVVRWWMEEVGNDERVSELWETAVEV